MLLRSPSKHSLSIKIRFETNTDQMEKRCLSSVAESSIRESTEFPGAKDTRCTYIVKLTDGVVLCGMVVQRTACFNRLMMIFDQNCEGKAN